MARFLVWLRDTTERAFTTALEAFLGVLIVSEQIDLSGAEMALAAAVAGGFSVLKQALNVYMPTPANWTLDALVRMGWTFLQTFAGVIVAAHASDLFTVTVWQSAAAAGLAAAGAALKALLAARVTRTVTPASLAKTPA